MLWCRCVPYTERLPNRFRNEEKSPEDTKWKCYSRSNWKKFLLKLWVVRNLNRLVSTCVHLRKGLTASAPPFQHFLCSGGRAELTEEIYCSACYLRAKCLSKASANMYNWDRSGRFHNKTSPNYHHSCQPYAEAKKYSQPWLSWLPSVIFCKEWIKKEDEASCQIQ